MLTCQHCGAELQPGAGNFYRVTIEAVADPTPPSFSEDDLARDVRQRIEQILARLEGLSEQEAMDQVFRRVTFWLCNPCFRRWIEKSTRGT
jgi:hypothetical protein